MRVFVTGGSGFVGGHVIRALFESEVVAMARSDRSAEVVTGLGASAQRCDLDTVGPEHLDGCDAVIHCAAFVEEWGTRDEYVRGNVDGTVRLLQAAETAGVKRFVHTGTEAMLFSGHDLVNVDESTPEPTRHRFLYSETKGMAERAVLGANGGAMTTISIRPRFVWGPGDTSVLPAIRRMVDEGAYAWIDQGRHETSTAHVANVAHALVLALRHGEGGKAYFIADAERHTIKDFLTALAEADGFALPARSFPGVLIRPTAALLEGAYRLFGVRRKPPLTHFAAAMMSRTVTVNTARAQAELGYAPVVDFAEGLALVRAAQTTPLWAAGPGKPGTLDPEG